MDQELVTAAGDGDSDRVQTLLKQGADVNYKLLDTGTTPLMAAARRGHVEIGETLLDAGADINAGDQNVGTALYWAAFEGQTAMMNFLLENGAKMNCDKDAAAYLLARIHDRGDVDLDKVVYAQLKKEGIMDSRP